MSSPATDDQPALIGTPAPATPGAAGTGRPRVVWSAALLTLLAAVGGGGYYYYGMEPGTGGAAAQGGSAKGGPGGGDFKKGGGRFGPGGGGPMPVVAALVHNESMDVRLAALGNVVPRNSVVVRSRVDGPLLRVHFKEGQQVKAGQLLAEIDPLPLQASMAQMNGQHARDLALLQNAQIDLDRYKQIRRYVEEWKADALVIHSVKSCRLFSAGQGDMRDYFANELGVPTLLVESDLEDPRYYAQAMMKNRIDAFFESLEHRKLLRKVPV